MPDAPREPAGRPVRSGGAGGRSDRSGVGGLVGAGPSMVGVSGSMRARDVSRPGDEHDEAAERDVVIRRRPPLPPKD
ncbi:MAG TPA: hypothetical protein VNA14_00575 [Mycobacteriales bacterium]|nr:hypothetical protein [Mycobacteriales bacterium]